MIKGGKWATLFPITIPFYDATARMAYVLASLRIARDLHTNSGTHVYKNTRTDTHTCAYIHPYVYSTKEARTRIHKLCHSRTYLHVLCLFFYFLYKFFCFHSSANKLRTHKNE